MPASGCPNNTTKRVGRRIKSREEEEMRKTKKSSSTSDSECCQQQPATDQTLSSSSDADADASPKQLDDGFYEIETIRRKRLRKGEVQYLIKWRGWPETANTWEPLHNLQSVPDLIHAFEDSLKSGRKRSRRTTTHLPPPRPHSQPPQTTSQQHIPQTTNHQNTHNLPQQTAQSNGYSLQTQPTPNTDNHRRGTNRRKSGSVKRFKKQESASHTNNALGISVAAHKLEPGSTVRNHINTHQNAKTACNIVKIIKPIGYSTSLSCYRQEVLVTFMAMRSDGTEVVVDNKYLKTDNPLLLINFYEKHLRYNPT